VSSVAAASSRLASCLIGSGRPISCTGPADALAEPCDALIARAESNSCCRCWLSAFNVRLTEIEDAAARRLPQDRILRYKWAALEEGQEAMEPEERRLADVASADIITVPDTASVADARAAAAAAGAAWIVITDAESRPVRVLPTAELTQVPAARPIATAAAGLVFVLPSRLPVDLLGRTGQVRRNAADLLNIRGIVIYDEHPAKPVGVWAGPSLNHYLFLLSPSRTYDPTLPGIINIPPIQRTCEFTEAALTCGFLRKFDELPDDMPLCDNPKHLTAHSFTW
jgi:hypothetical protein